MNFEFWACFKCGDYFRGSASEIKENSRNHQSLCANNSMERENINKIINGLQGFSSLLPPPPPPPPPPTPLPPLSPSNSKKIWTKPTSNENANQKENKVPNGFKSKMPIDVVNSLENFFK